MKNTHSCYKIRIYSFCQPTIYQLVIVQLQYRIVQSLRAILTVTASTATRLHAVAVCSGVSAVTAPRTAVMYTSIFAAGDLQNKNIKGNSSKPIKIMSVRLPQFCTCHRATREMPSFQWSTMSKWTSTAKADTILSG